jgi:hypothetical protein
VCKRRRHAGPKTPAGKQRARLGALTHGFFAKELPLNDEEKRQLEETRRQLQSQLLPTTVLQHITFAEIIACIGRCMLALRLEMLHVSRLLGPSNEQQAQPEQPGAGGGSPEWYLSGRQGLRYGLKILEDVKQEFSGLGTNRREMEHFARRNLWSPSPTNPHRVGAPKQGCGPPGGHADKEVPNI